MQNKLDLGAGNIETVRGGVHLKKHVRLFVRIQIIIKFVLGLLHLREGTFQDQEDVIVNLHADNIARKIQTVAGVLEISKVIALRKCAKKLRIAHGPIIHVHAETTVDRQLQLALTTEGIIAKQIRTNANKIVRKLRPERIPNQILDQEIQQMSAQVKVVIG